MCMRPSLWGTPLPMGIYFCLLKRDVYHRVLIATVYKALKCYTVLKLSFIKQILFRGIPLVLLHGNWSIHLRLWSGENSMTD